MTRAEAENFFPDGCFFLCKKSYGDVDVFCASIAFHCWYSAIALSGSNVVLARWISFVYADQAIDQAIGIFKLDREKVFVLDAKQARHKCLLSGNKV